MKSAENALQIWEFLVQHASVGQHLTYEDISKRTGKRGQNWMIPSLDMIQNYCLSAGLPPLTSVVVQKQSEKPGSGYVCRLGVVEKDWEWVHSFNWSEQIKPNSTELTSHRTPGGRRHISPMTEKLTTTTYRLGMEEFRRKVLANFGGVCCVCGLADQDLLDAAHIRGWAKDPQSRLRIENGLALCALHHRALDRSLLRVEREGEIWIAESLRKRSGLHLEMFGAFHGKFISSPRVRVVFA